MGSELLLIVLATATAGAAATAGFAMDTPTRGADVDAAPTLTRPEGVAAASSRPASGTDAGLATDTPTRTADLTATPLDLPELAMPSEASDELLLGLVPAGTGTRG